MHVLSIGNFDGVHEGHQALLARAREVAVSDGSRGLVTAVTFDPLPRTVVAPGSGPPLIESIRERVRSLRAAGADHVEVLAVDRAFLEASPVAFLTDLVARVSGKERVGGFVEGADFCFGKARAGSLDTLRTFGLAEGMVVESIETKRVALASGETVEARSSTVRSLLEEGRVEDAACVLGRVPILEGRVVRGEARGRELGFPTANLDVEDRLLPREGVYAGVALLPNGERWATALSIGTKPTFKETPLVAEAHLIGWNGPIGEYDWVMNVELTCWLRAQERFDSIEALKAKIEEDCAAAVAHYRS
jgi:riboflavin kinase/FMN adenylyltransferase